MWKLIKENFWKNLKDFALMPWWKEIFLLEIS
jgi:hypothetical protein